MQSKAKRNVLASVPHRTDSSQMARVMVRTPRVESFTDWMGSFGEDEPRDPYLVLPGKSADRHRFLQKVMSEDRIGVIDDLIGPEALGWLDQGPCKNLLARAAKLSLPKESRRSLPTWFPPEPGNWELLWGLIAVDDFIVDEPIRSMLDQNFYVVHDVYRVLWEARFLAKENESDRSQAQLLVRTLVRWMTTPMLTAEDQRWLDSIGIRRPITSEQRFELFCMLVGLAWQNGLLSRYMIYFDGLELADGIQETVLKELSHMLSALERWIRIGPCPIGLVIGYTAESSDLHDLRSTDDRLYDKIVKGLNWVRAR